MTRKIGLFFLSLWLLFVLIIVITAKIPICFTKECSFVGFPFLLKTNIVPLLCFFALIVGVISYIDFKFQMMAISE